MALNEFNILTRANGIVTGSKFLKEVELPMISAVRVTADGNPVSSSTAPTLTTVGLSFDDSETALLHFDVPQDYDASVDKCALRLHEVPSADAAHTTDLGITTAQSLYRAGAAVNATAKTAVAEAATASTGAKVRENVLDISGRGYQPGDHVILTLDANNSSTTELILLGVDLIYSSCIRAYKDADVSRLG